MKQFVLCILLGIGAYMDYKEDRIPNGLCAFGVLFGVWLRALCSGLPQMYMILKGVSLTFVMLFPLWFLKILGGGDVKLLLMSGFYLGEKVGLLLLMAALCTAMYALALMIYRGNFLKRIDFFLHYVRSCILLREWRPYPFDRENLEDCAQGGIHVSYGILGGFFLGKITGLF